MAYPSVNLSGPLAPINLSTSGDHSLIAGSAGTVITIYKLVIWVASACTIVLKNGNSGQTPVAINGASGFNLPAQTSFIYNGDENPLIMTPGNDFVLNLGSSVNVNGWAYYAQPTLPTV